MKVFGISHVGNIRDLNEDSYYVSDSKVGAVSNLYIIADGMGGHNAGEVASKLAVDGFLAYMKDHQEGSVDTLFEKAVMYANEQIYKQAEADQRLHGMGTTFVACCVNEGENMLYVANVGDSRLYALCQHLDQITMDHSYVEELVRSGDITREESINHPDRNIITRALGTDLSVAVDLFKMPLNKVNKVLLCSDGLSNMMTDTDMEAIIGQSLSPKEIGEQLLQLALEAGGNDNITLILIDLTDEMEAE